MNKSKFLLIKRNYINTVAPQHHHTIYRSSSSLSTSSEPQAPHSRGTEDPPPVPLLDHPCKEASSWSSIALSSS